MDIFLGRTASSASSAALAEQHDEWIEGRNDLGLDVLARARPALAGADEPQSPTSSC